MRSHPFVKRTLPCLAVVMAVTLQSGPAHAGILNKMFSAAAQVLNGKMAQPKAAATSTTATGPQVQTMSEASQGPAKTVNMGAATSATSSLTQDAIATQAPYNIETDFIAKVIQENHVKVEKFYGSNGLRKLFRAEAEKVDVVHTDTHTEIVADYTEKGLVLKVRYDETALKNPQYIAKEMAVISALTSATDTFLNSTSSQIFSGKIESSLVAEVESPHAVAEILANIKEGSPTAKARWASIEARILKATELKAQYLQDLNLSSNALNQVREQIEAQLPELNAKAAQHIRKQQKSLDQWKAQTGALDKMEAMQDKLDDLILKNDRKGVRQLLESYLPWAVMEPVEANTWKIWLDAIENPDMSKTTVAFRGLKYDTDKIQRRQTTKGEAFGFMSTVLTKNQGSYTRRLRSLSTNREKNGDIGMTQKTAQNFSVKITDQMTAHAKNPVASSFISFTYDPAVAYRFMGQDVMKEIKGEKVKVPYGGMLVVKMDSRRMIPNLPSMYSNEIELLAPLIVFPDEVVSYKEGSFTSDYTFDMFIKEISAKTGINFSSWSLAQDANNENLRQRYSREGHEFLRQITEVKASTNACSKVF